MEEDKNLEQNLDKSNEKLHISDVITRCIHNFVDEIVISENIDRDKLKYSYDVHCNITITETKEKSVRWFTKNIYNEL
jgi:hypothetical protein